MATPRPRTCPRRLTRKQKLPLHLGLFAVYIAVQLASSAFSATVAPVEPGQKEEVAGASTAAEAGSSTPGEDLETTMSILMTSPAPAPSPIPKKKGNFMRPPRENCSPPAIEQFPQPIIGPSVRRHGGLIIHILLAVYSFLGLAIVCDDYFVASLDRICEELKLSPDVAGATFMAAGSSAPELATVIIGVFFAKDDIGVSGVIGSAVFNIMFVISVCGLCTTTVSKLNWWPLCRDCFFYALSILVMLITIFNEIISWPEALFMLILYVVYCVALAYNDSLERWAKSYNIPWLPKDEEPAEQSALVTYKSLQEDKGTYNAASTGATDLAADQVKSAQGYNTWDDQQQSAGQNQYGTTNQWDQNSSWDPNAMWDSGNANAMWDGQQQQQLPPPQQQQQQQQPQEQPMSPETAQQQQQQQQAGTVQSKPNYYKAKEYDPNEKSPLEMPENANAWALFKWRLVYPIHYLCRTTTPDCRQDKYKNWYPFTFFMAMLWISFYSYIMVWMITIIGATLGIPDTVMGLTFVAAGVSVPDALSSLAVIKEGLGDMAVSNAVGSNVFDILVCLGLPWFIQTAIIKPGSHVNVISRGLTYSTISLLSTVVFLVVATHMNGWKLDRRYGVVLMIWYLIFIVFAALYELNFFGEMNPPSCPSSY